MNPALTLFSALPFSPALALSATVAGTAPPPAAVEPAPPAPAAESPAPKRVNTSAFDRMFALGFYGTGWAGSYAGVGVGGRIRVEPWRYFGVDLFGEALIVETPNGLRHDHPIGFNIYVPFPLGPDWRIRPLLGLCAVGSFIEAEQTRAPRADDLLVGAHTGAGVERAFGPYVSFFVEAQGTVWMGHDRAVQGWTGAVGNDLKPFGVAQAMMGLAAHLGSK